MSVIDLSKLPAPEVIEEISFEALLQEMLDELAARMPELDVAVSDPAYKVLEVAAYWRMLDRQRANDRARRLLAAYAGGGDLDHIGVTYYGTERQAGESDAAYLRRMLLAYDSWSTAGSENSYVYHALGADPAVRDATAINRGAGEVLITVLAAEGDGTAPQAVLDTVKAALDAERVRPLNDRVTVQSASVTAYQVRAELVLREGPSPEVVAAQAKTAVEAYTEARHRLGEDVVRGAIEAALYVEGVERATLLEPLADIANDETQAAFCTAVEVTAGE
jgi:phage-related baseplate assembly protein